MPTSLRPTDSAAESEVAKFLDKNFYPKHVTNFERYNDYSKQMAGIDVRFSYSNVQDMLVDEKALSHYVNKNLPTSAFEVDFITNSNSLVDGWLFDTTKSTGYYLIAWLWATKEKYFKAEDITQVDLIIIARKKIIEMLYGFGLSQASAKEISKELRLANRYGASYRESGKPFYFFYSTQLSEKPVNIVIHKSKLIQLSLGRHIIRPDSTY